MKTIAPFAATVAAAALLTASAIAQTPPKDNKTMPPSQTQTSPSPSTSSQSAATAQQNNQWRGSQLIGLDVYNTSNENIGDINDVILGKDGKVELIVVGVGGWLGMGQHDVALRWEQVSFSDQPPKGNSASTEQGEKPDHAMVNMSKDQLKALSAFKYSGDQNKT